MTEKIHKVRIELNVNVKHIIVQIMGFPSFMLEQHSCLITHTIQIDGEKKLKIYQFQRSCALNIG